MARKTRTICVFILFLLALSMVAHAAEWYQGGTLHKATIAEWKKATPANKLATCGDFIAALYGNNRLNLPISTVDSIKPYAEELVICIDMAAGDDDEIDNQPVDDMAVMGMVLMEWTK